MSPDAALQKQIELYRAMTGEQCVKIALDLHTFACNLSRIRIRRQNPHATPDEVELELKRRIQLGQR